MPRRLHLVLSVFRSAFGNPTLRLVGTAYALFSTAEFGIWLILLVVAYQRGGPTAGMTMVLVQLIPCILLAPFMGSFGDRHRPSRVLLGSYLFQAVTFAAVAVGVGTDAPTTVLYLLAALAALSLTATRPAQAALLPAIVRTPDELTAANVMTGWTEGGASLAGPAIAGVVLALSGPTLAVAVMGACNAVSAVLVAGVAGPSAAVQVAPAPDGDSPAEDGNPAAPDSITAGARAALAISWHNPQLRVLLVLHAFYFVLIGSLDLLCVILALTVFHLGAGGAGYLNAALGGGALLAGFVTAFLVGRSHLSRTITLSLAVSVAALALIAVVHNTAAAFFLIAIVGLAGTVFDITGRTLLQRAAPPDAIAGAFSILEATTDFGLATGAVLVRVAIGVGGVKAALDRTRRPGCAPHRRPLAPAGEDRCRGHRAPRRDTAPPRPPHLCRPEPAVAGGRGPRARTGERAGRQRRHHRGRAGRPLLRGGRRTARRQPRRGGRGDRRPRRWLRRDRPGARRPPTGHGDRGHRLPPLLARQGPFRPHLVRPRLGRVSRR